MQTETKGKISPLSLWLQYWICVTQREMGMFLFIRV